MWTKWKDIVFFDMNSQHQIDVCIADSVADANCLAVHTFHTVRWTQGLQGISWEAGGKLREPKELQPLFFPGWRWSRGRRPAILCPLIADPAGRSQDTALTLRLSGRSSYICTAQSSLRPSKYLVICVCSAVNDLNSYIVIIYLTYMQNTSCKMPGWMNHKLKSRLPGEISITSNMQMIPL